MASKQIDINTFKTQALGVSIITIISLLLLIVSMIACVKAMCYTEHSVRVVNDLGPFDVNISFLLSPDIW